MSSAVNSVSRSLELAITGIGQVDWPRRLCTAGSYHWRPRSGGRECGDEHTRVAGIPAVLLRRIDGDATAGRSVP
jgi:hypothetical protein